MQKIQKRLVSIKLVQFAKTTLDASLAGNLLATAGHTWKEHDSIDSIRFPISRGGTMDRTVRHSKAL